MSRLSRESNMAYKTIQTIWRDPYHEVTTTTLNKLARTLGVDPSELIEYTPCPYPWRRPIRTDRVHARVKTHAAAFINVCALHILSKAIYQAVI